MPAVSTKTPVEQAQAAYEKASNSKATVERATANREKANSAFAVKVKKLDEAGIKQLETGIAKFHKDKASTDSGSGETQDLIEVQ